MAWLKEGRVVASFQPVPLQLLPPILLALHHGAAIWPDGWEAPETPASPEPDGLEIGGKHLGLADPLQLIDPMQVDVLQLWEDVLQLWELQYAIPMIGSYSCQKLFLHREYLNEVTTVDNVKRL